MSTFASIAGLPNHREAGSVEGASVDVAYSTVEKLVRLSSSDGLNDREPAYLTPDEARVVGWALMEAADECRRRSMGERWMDGTA